MCYLSRRQACTTLHISARSICWLYQLFLILEAYLHSQDGVDDAHEDDEDEGVDDRGEGRAKRVDDDAVVIHYMYVCMCVCVLGVCVCRCVCVCMNE